jgi:hypothetical protein
MQWEHSASSLPIPVEFTGTKPNMSYGTSYGPGIMSYVMMPMLQIPNSPHDWYMGTLTLTGQGIRTQGGQPPDMFS